MTATIDYYFALISPWTYLGAARFATMAECHGARVNVKPIDLSRIFPESGGLPLAKRAPQRQAYRLVELQRWRDHLGQPLNLKPKFFPAAQDQAARLVVALREQGGDAMGLAHAILRAVWVEEKNIADPASLAAIATARGIDAKTLMRAAAPAIQAAHEADTMEALKRGVFGAPTYVLNDELFWGQDRLDFLERALAKAA